MSTEETPSGKKEKIKFGKFFRPMLRTLEKDNRERDKMRTDNNWMKIYWRANKRSSRNDNSRVLRTTRYVATNSKKSDGQDALK